jgi:PAS domain S-box-containing protein
MSPDLFGIAGFDGYLKQLNPAWEALLGYTTDELMAKPFLDFIHPDDHNDNNAEIAKLAAGHMTIDFENRYIHKDGSVRHISWTATPLPEEGILYCIGRDISQRKKTEEQILNYQQRLKDLTEQLILSEEKQNKLIATNLHDHVGQLLASSRLQLAALNDDISKAEILSKTGQISRGLLQAIQATREVIFDLSPPQLNEIGLYAATADWMDEEVETKHGIKARITGDDRVYNIDNNMRILLFRSIRELLMNVVKHARANRVDVNISETAKDLNITVKDDGKGFRYNPEMLRLKGSGFGLFSIQERVANYGGYMSIESSPGEGTSIKLSIPLSGSVS